MANYTTIEELKRHLNIESSFTGDDLYLQDLISTSELAIQNYCNNGLSEITISEMPIDVKHALLLLALHFYQNRTMVSFAQGVEIPYSFKFLLAPYRNFVIS